MLVKSEIASGSRVYVGQDLNFPDDLNGRLNFLIARKVVSDTKVPRRGRRS